MKAKKILNISIKTAVILLCYGFIVYKIQDTYSTSIAGYQINFQGIKIYTVLALLFFMLVNWSVEAIKWKMLVRPFQKLHFITSLLSVLAGITIGLFTPKRLGDVGGRCVMLDNGNRTKGIVSFGVNSVIQTGVTIFFGLFSLVILLFHSTGFSDKQYVILFFAALILFLLVIWMLSHLPALKRMLLKIPLLKKNARHLEYIEELNFRSIIQVFILGMLRYMIFATQFLILLNLFGMELPPLLAFTGVGLTYFLMAFVPLSSIAELGLRGSVAVFVFSLFTPVTLPVILTTFSLWIINLALPAVIGSVIIFRSSAFNLNKTLFKKYSQFSKNSAPPSKLKPVYIKIPNQKT